MVIALMVSGGYKDVGNSFHQAAVSHHLDCKSFYHRIPNQHLCFPIIMLTFTLFASILLALPTSLSALPQLQLEARQDEPPCEILPAIGLDYLYSDCIVRAKGGEIPEEEDCTVIGDTASACQFGSGIVLHKMCVRNEDICSKVVDENGIRCQNIQLNGSGRCPFASVWPTRF
ncbi:hypothetical protein DM02DRAFT_34131 [Periconia macrospinosa]|uniref:Uncharacterized protein n=1 Tax=Periconia macrospinosa TaxID=97972 RepID=A0A2V1E7F6_9PLEO|nr:hypothetical protein DM02DRAFT_34131 [Periconia macrospinosa]